MARDHSLYAAHPVLYWLGRFFALLESPRTHTWVGYGDNVGSRTLLCRTNRPFRCVRRPRGRGAIYPNRKPWRCDFGECSTLLTTFRAKETQPRSYDELVMADAAYTKMVVQILVYKHPRYLQANSPHAPSSTVLNAITMKFSLLALLPAVLAAPADVSTRETKQQATDRYIFSNTLPAFLQARAKQPDGLDWSSDGCSSASDNPFGFPFLPACQRHDFGYRNYKAQSRFSSANRKKIDEKFLEE